MTFLAEVRRRTRNNYIIQTTSILSHWPSSVRVWRLCYSAESAEHTWQFWL